MIIIGDTDDDDDEDEDEDEDDEDDEEDEDEDEDDEDSDEDGDHIDVTSSSSSGSSSGGGVEKERGESRWGREERPLTEALTKKTIQVRVFLVRFSKLAILGRVNSGFALRAFFPVYLFLFA